MEKEREENWRGIENTCIIDRNGDNHISSNPKQVTRIGYWIIYVLKLENPSID